MNTVHVLDACGDIKISWDPADPAEVAEARAAVLRLKAEGYQFFLVDGTEAPDEVSAGQGTLNCRRVEAEELLPADVERTDAEATSPEAAAPKRGRGRPRKDAPAETPGPVQAVATRPLRGG